MVGTKELEYKREVLEKKHPEVESKRKVIVKELVSKREILDTEEVESKREVFVEELESSERIL